MLTKIGGRKIVAALIALLCGIVTLLFKGDIPPGFLTLLQTLFAAFVLGNVGEHVAGAFRSNQEDADSQPDPQIVYLTTQLEKLNSDIAKLTSVIESKPEPSLPDPSPGLIYMKSKMDKLDEDVTGLTTVLKVVNDSLNTTQQAISYIIQRAFPKA